MSCSMPIPCRQSALGPRTHLTKPDRRPRLAACTEGIQGPIATPVAPRGIAVPLALRKRAIALPKCHSNGGRLSVAAQSIESDDQIRSSEKEETSEFRKMRLKRQVEARREELTYSVAALGATFLVGSMAFFATYYRFLLHMEDSGEFPWFEFAATMALVCVGVAGMEMYARWAHKFLWHDFKPGWALHKSHHEPRTGPFEDNDIFAVVNAFPAIGLCWYGLFTPNLLGGICWGSGLGITLFGMMYMFVHDGLVHKRFPVGPIAKVPYLKRIAAAHKLHHINDFNGLPWGLFLAEQELRGVPGAIEQLEKLLAIGDKS